MAPLIDVAGTIVEKVDGPAASEMAAASAAFFFLLGGRQHLLTGLPIRRTIAKCQRNCNLQIKMVVWCWVGCWYYRDRVCYKWVMYKGPGH